MATTPSTSLATLRPDLAGSLELFDLQMNQAGFVGLELAPVIQVAKTTGTFGKIPIEELLKGRETRRAPGSAYSRGNGRFTTDTYSCKEHGTEEAVDDRESEMYADYFDAEQLAASRARHIVMEAYERRIVALALANANTNAAGTAWSTPATANPIDNVRTAMLAVYNRTGVMPNTLAVAWSRLQFLKDCAVIVDRVKYSGHQNPAKGAINVAAIAQALGVDRIVVAGSMKNTANEAQAASLSPIWDEAKALVCRTATTNDHREPCLLRTFHWSADGSSIGAAMESYRDETVRSNIIRARMDTDEKVIFEAAGQVITGV